MINKRNNNTDYVLRNFLFFLFNYYKEFSRFVNFLFSGHGSRYRFYDFFISNIR